jgi:hypothetical protein
MDRTAAWAPDREQGWLLEHVLPLPDGDANSVVVAAEAGSAEAAMTATVAAAAVASTAPATSGFRRAWGRRDMPSPWGVNQAGCNPGRKVVAPRARSNPDDCYFDACQARSAVIRSRTLRRRRDPRTCLEHRSYV